MHAAIPKLSEPEWLSRLTAASMQSKPFPYSEVLKDSCYYAGAGHDGTPVKYFGGNVLSFVYSDYAVRREEVVEKIYGLRTGFAGYNIVGMRDVSQHELTPNGWQTGDAVLERWLWENENRRNVNWFTRGRGFVPFALWVVFERKATSDPATRPFRFSLLYICGESVATYQALYNSNGIVPRMLYLINHGFGGNWTDFEQPERIYARVVGSHPQGIPEWLVARSFYSAADGAVLAAGALAADRASPWPRLYPGGAVAMLTEESWFSVWKRGRVMGQTGRFRNDGWRISRNRE